MAKGRRRRRQRRGKRKKPPSKAATATIDDVPDHVLQLILLRVGSPASLFRAAASCRRWRRVVADASFIHSFRSLHGTHRIAGRYHTIDPVYGPPLPPLPGGHHFVFVPSTPLTGVDDRRCFSLDFLPDGGDSWELVDCRGNLLLLLSKKACHGGGVATVRRLTDLVVCEPLTRRYQVILCPANLNFYMCLGVFLLDGGCDDDDGTTATGSRISISSFRVIAVLFDRHRWLEFRGMPMSFLFSSSAGDGSWRVVQGTTLDDVDLPEWIELIRFVGRANGRLYWGIEDEDGATFVLDENTLEFSIVMFPESIWAPYDKWTFRVIGGGGDLRVVRVVGNDLKVFRQLHGGGGGEWVLERLVSLPEATRGLPGREEWFLQHEAMIVAADAEHILVTLREKRYVFSVELETMEVESEHERNRYPGAAYQYESPPWPPSLQACTDGLYQREDDAMQLDRCSG